jgi:hypothetical protein
MKLWELIVELEKLEQQGKRDYNVQFDYVEFDEVYVDEYINAVILT